MSAEQRQRNRSVAAASTILSSVGAIDIIQEASDRLSGRLAIMAKLAQGHSLHKQDSVNHEVEQHFWRGVELLELENLEDIQAITTAAAALYDSSER